MAAVEEVNTNATSDLADLLDAGDGAVVTLVAGETRLAAHRAVLAARSPVFAAMLRHDTLEANSGEVNIADVEGPVLRQFVAYLYASRAPQLPSMAPQLLAVADKYGVTVLKAECERQVSAQLSVDSAAAAAVLAVRHSCAGLRQEAVAFIKANTYQVMATQGWANAVLHQPQDVVEVSRLLAELHEEASGALPAAAAAGGPSGSPGTQASAAVATARDAPPPDEVTVARYRSLSAQDKGRKLIEESEVGAVEEMQALLAAGADVRARNRDGTTALYWAAYGGHVEAARVLLQSGAEVNARHMWQSTPLHPAAASGHTDVVRLLLESSADANARRDDGMTPLHCAAQNGHTEVVVALIQAGADRSATTANGKTPLDLARQNNRQQLVGLLT